MAASSWTPTGGFCVDIRNDDVQADELVVPPPTFHSRTGILVFALLHFVDDEHNSSRSCTNNVQWQFHNLRFLHLLGKSSIANIRALSTWSRACLPDAWFCCYCNKYHRLHTFHSAQTHRICNTQELQGRCQYDVELDARAEQEFSKNHYAWWTIEDFWEDSD